MRELTDVAFKKVGGASRSSPSPSSAGRPGDAGYPRGPMVAAWHDSFAKQLRRSPPSTIAMAPSPGTWTRLELQMDPSKNGFGSGNHVVNYIGSHDQERILKQIAEIGRTPSVRRRSAREAGDGAAARLRPGLPMIWMGQEFGAANPKTMEPAADRLALLQNKDNTDLKNYTQGLVNMRGNEPAWPMSRRGRAQRPRPASVRLQALERSGQCVRRARQPEQHARGDVTIENVGLEDGTWQIRSTSTRPSPAETATRPGPSEVKIFIKQ